MSLVAAILLLTVVAGSGSLVSITWYHHRPSDQQPALRRAVLLGVILMGIVAFSLIYTLTLYDEFRRVGWKAGQPGLDAALVAYRQSMSIAWGILMTTGIAMIAVSLLLAKLLNRSLWPWEFIFSRLNVGLMLAALITEWRLFDPMQGAVWDYLGYLCWFVELVLIAVVSVEIWLDFTRPLTSARSKLARR